MTILRRAPLLLKARGPRSHVQTRSVSNGLTIGIRREDPSRIWERRCPLTPEAINELVTKEGVNVVVQPCERRVFTMRELQEAGAVPQETLSPAHVIIGIKETPLEEVLTDPLPLSGRTVPRTHLKFSHTHKGQEYNMELLSKFLNPPTAPAGHIDPLRPTLIDYELLTDESGKRTVGFGWYAGVAGALESLAALAHALLEQGVASPFLSTPRPHTQPCLRTLMAALRTLVGDRIASEGTPAYLGPVVICVTGTGKVAQGALDLLAELPHQQVRVEDLPRLVRDPDTDLHKIYVVHALPKDYFVRADAQPYDRTHYYANPDQYDSVFHQKIAPYLTLLVHGAGWAGGYPRMMTNEHLRLALEAARGVGPGRFTCVGDISCDIEGGLEFLPRHSTLSDPFFKTRPSSLPSHLPEITMMAVDILPTALSRDASQHFSDVLRPYLSTLLASYSGAPIVCGEERAKAHALERATIAKGGVLTERHRWLEDGPLGAWRAQAQASTATSAAPKKKVLVLGSGMVAGPAVDEIARHGDVELVVASNVLDEAKRLTAHHANASAVRIDMSDLQRVGQLVKEADLVVSLLPVPFHPAVAELCLEHKKHLVTASYISPAMRSLHERAVAADVVLLNEIGLDPGIDHCSAIALLSKLQQEHKRVTSFTSFCGGLPAPEHAEGVPLKYKFSWSPRGVLGAALNGARFKLWGELQEIEGKDILKEGFPHLPVSDVLKLEGIANRDSLHYADVYSLGKLEDLRTLVRGTIRYPGFSSLMHSFKSIGLLDVDRQVKLQHWFDLPREVLSAKLGTPIPNDAASFASALLNIMSKSEATEVIDALSWLGLLPESAHPLTTPVPSAPAAPIDLFATVLAHQLRYHPGERDLVVLQHELVARPAALPGHAPADEEEVHTSTLVAYGDARASAMARTVGMPLAFAARAVLDGAVRTRGVCGPGVEREIWARVLAGLEQAGLGMREGVSRRKVPGGGGRVERALAEARGLVV
ncbi:saccharopine dehydrogenase-domain-containing protein [Phanerochaete sordida]|uniref:Saccharopine dehydrogenase-domain-containing protein n=1 Tax=Phanerochaete sordida TaxID=48140 RepID=A0A9P3GFL6_9APHY|nr:saccharopine dehydrogenase-domain-containing protein [Phanerochaete sordida]